MFDSTVDRSRSWAMTNFWLNIEFRRHLARVQIWNVCDLHIYSFNLNFRYMATWSYTHMSCNAVTLVLGLRVCCRLYCYECAAQVKIANSNKRVIFFWYSFVLWWWWFEPSISLHVQMQRAWLAVLDTDSHMTCSTDMDSCMTCSKNIAFYKPHAAARLPHWLPYICMS